MTTINDTKSKKMRIIMGVNIFICVCVLLVPILMPKNDRVAVILPPWADSARIMQVISDAGGELINGGRRDWIAVATSQSTDFVSKLYKAGAVMVIDGSIAAACL